MPFRAASSTGNTSGNNITNPIATLPVSGTGGTVVAGDVAWIFIDAADTGTLTPPAGWTLSESQGLTTDSQPTTAHSTRRYWKALTAGDISGSTVTFTGSGAQRRSLECIVFYDVDNTTPEATETPAGIGYSTSSSTRVNPSTTLLGTRDVIIHAGNRSGTTTTSWTRPGVWVHAIDAFNSGTGGATGSIAYKEALAAGAVGGDTWTASNATTGAVTMLVVVKPASIAYTKTPADAEGITDSATHEHGTTAVDPVGVTDSATSEHGITSADPVGATDSATRVADTVRAQADPVGATDSATQVVDSVRAATDPVGATDAASTALDGVRAVTDPSGITDALTLERSTTATDPVGVTDAASTTADVVRSAADPVGLSDSATHDHGTTASDPVGVTDAVSFILDAVRPVDDPVGVTDSAISAMAGDAVANPTDAEPITDDASHTLDAARAASENVGITDSVTVSVTVAATVADPVAISDEVLAQLDRVVTVSDLLGLIDEVSSVVATPYTPEPQRTYRIAAELRVIYVEAEARTYRIPAETRTLEVVQP